jgi:hypothetical protein
MRETTTATCPNTPGPVESTIIGCGTVFTAVPDAEGLLDCPVCGMWFRPSPNAAPLTHRINPFHQLVKRYVMEGL